MNPEQNAMWKVLRLRTGRGSVGMGRLSFANLTAGDGPLKSQQLLAEFHHLFPQLVLDVGLLADPSFRSNQSGDQTVFGFSEESSDFRVQRRSVLRITLLV